MLQKILFRKACLRYAMGNIEEIIYFKITSPEAVEVAEPYSRSMPPGVQYRTALMFLAEAVTFYAFPAA